MTGNPRDRDMTPDELRAAAEQVVGEMVDFLANLESLPVLPDVEPGAVRSRLPSAPPDHGESIEDILADFRAHIRPNLTQWQHPGFLAYFPSVACGPGILGEMLAAALNSNVMLWRNAPASTELEELVVDWLRQMLGLPEAFRGMFTDTASISSLLSVAAAREAVPGFDWKEHGANDAAAPQLVLYRSSEAHSSIDKAAMVLGLGRRRIRSVPCDDRLRMRPDALQDMIRADREAGLTPFCVVATIGTTSSTAVDPAAPIADVCRAEGLWLHIDAAYAGAAACLPELRHHFEGWERADSIVFNLHKWLFTPFDASLLLFCEPERYRAAFSVVPEYLRTKAPPSVTNFNEYGIQLGRRFRALKVWMMLRYFGGDGIRAMLRRHRQLASELQAAVEREPNWELAADAPFATLCIRYVDDRLTPIELDRITEGAMETVNGSGRYFLSHTEIDGRFVIRVAIGNPRQRAEHVMGCFEALRTAARQHAGS